MFDWNICQSIYEKVQELRNLIEYCAIETVHPSKFDADQSDTENHECLSNDGNNDSSSASDDSDLDVDNIDYSIPSDSESDSE